MKKIALVLTPLIVQILLCGQASAQVYENLSDIAVASWQADGSDDQPFDPFADQKKLAAETEKEPRKLQEDDLGLDKEPNLGDEPGIGSKIEDLSEDEGDVKYENDSSQNQPTKQSRISIEEYLRPINEVSANPATELAPARGGIDFPDMISPVVQWNAPRNTWAYSSYDWQKPLEFHRRLYYEDIPLERCGVQAGKWQQNVISGVKFFGDTILVPVKRLRQPRFQTYQRTVNRYSDPQLFGK